MLGGTWLAEDAASAGGADCSSDGYSYPDEASGPVPEDSLPGVVMAQTYRIEGVSGRAAGGKSQVAVKGAPSGAGGR